MALTYVLLPAVKVKSVLKKITIKTEIIRIESDGHGCFESTRCPNQKCINLH